MGSDLTVRSEEWIRDPSGLQYGPWLAQGVQHRFCGKQLIAPAGGAEIVYLQQVHGSTVVQVLGASASEFRTERTGDAWIIRRDAKPGVALGLRTADCLPIIVRSNESLALIHAGWRGLVGRVISAALAQITDRDDGIELLIGPAAGPMRYEVGAEVVRAIGETALTYESEGGKALLDLAGSALREVRRAVRGDVRCAVAPVCTIEDPEFNSYRREGTASGRNITWVIPT